MWQSLKDTGYFLMNSNNLEVYVTDYLIIWHTRFTNTSFLCYLKCSNEGLEIDENELLSIGRNMLSKPCDLKTVRIVETEESKLNVTMTISCGLPIKLVFSLQKGSKELFFLKITLPLLRVIEDLKASQEELKQELIRKDKEIEEYKCEGGEIALRYLKTIPFNEQEHVSRHTAYDSHFNTTEIPKIVLQKTVDVPETKHDETNQESDNITPNGASVKIEVDNPSTNIKLESSAPLVTVEGSVEKNIKLEPNHNAKAYIENVKSELPNSQTSQRPLASPHKRKRSKLNFL